MFSKREIIENVIWSSKLEADYAMSFQQECNMIAEAVKEDMLQDIGKILSDLFNKNWEDQSEMAIVRRQAIDEVKETIIKELG